MTLRRPSTLPLEHVRTGGPADSPAGGAPSSPQRQFVVRDCDECPYNGWLFGGCGCNFPGGAVPDSIAVYGSRNGVPTDCPLRAGGVLILLAEGV